MFILSCIEDEDLALTTKVSDITPKFKGGLKEKVTISNLMTILLERLIYFSSKLAYGNLSAVIKAICLLELITIPSEVICYSLY